MANGLFNVGKGMGHLWNTVEGESFKVALVDGYVFNEDDNNSTTILGSYEVTGTNYVAGGANITTRTTTIDNTANLSRFFGDDAVWSSSTITADGALVYETGDNKPVAYIDFGGDKSSVNGDFTVQWSADGVFTIA